MPNCDMCGKDNEMLFKTLVEGVELNVCKQCSSFGKVLKRVVVETPKQKAKKAAIIEAVKEPEIIEMIIPEYAETIKQAREKSNLKQEELANKINEKLSLIQNIERDRFKPSMGLARKLEKFLNVKLVESVEDSNVDVQKSKGEGLTIGDFIKVRKK